jgi:hypothetical protein
MPLLPRSSRLLVLLWALGGSAAFPFSDWCPTIHDVRGMDPAGTFYDADASTWWQWVDNSAVHFSSQDLIHWEPANVPCGNGCGGWYGGTGAISFTSAGAIRLWPNTHEASCGGSWPIDSLSVPSLAAGVASNWSNWTGSGISGVIPIPTKADGNPVPNFRDSGRALRLSDGEWYVAVGSDAGTQPGNACNGSLPRNMTTDGPAALRLYRATNGSLSEFVPLGLAHIENTTLGFVRSSTAEWTAEPWVTPPFMECPDVFNVLGGKRQVFIASYGACDMPVFLRLQIFWAYTC